MTPAPDLTANVAEKQKIYAFNSTVLYLLAYFILFNLNQLATLFIARSNAIPTAIFPGHLAFKIPDRAWQVQQVISTYGAGPLFCLVAACFGVYLFNKVKHLGGLRKLFYLWLMLHGFNLFFGSLIAGTLARGGFWYAVRWSIPSDAATWAIAFVFGLILLFLGFLTAPGFLISCDSITLVQFGNRRQLLNAMLVWPWIIGSLVLVLLKFPDFTRYEGLLYLTMLLLLVPAYFFNLGNPISETVESPLRPHFATGLAALVVILFLIYRLSLQNGILFG